MTPTPDNTPPAPDGALTDAERAEQARLVNEVRTAYVATRRSALAVAASLLALLRRGLYREHDTFATFVEATFEFSGDYGYKHARWARLNEVLAEAGDAPLDAESQAREVTPLMEFAPDSDRVSDAARDRTLQAVRAARAAAEAEGVRLAARHLAAARAQVEGEREEAQVAEARRLLDALDGPGGEATGPGLHLASAGGVVPWTDGLEYEVRPDAVAPPEPVRLDDAAGRTYPVLLTAPGETARSWAPVPGPFRATYVPSRVGAPAPADADAAARDRVVLVAPGVDLLHERVPDRIIGEVVRSVRADPTRLYLVRTADVTRAVARAWPSNVSLVVEARTAGELAGRSAEVEAAVAGGFGTPWTVVVRDLADLPPDGARDLLGVFGWVLVRGKGTTSQALSAIYGAVPPEALHVGREVTSRPQASPLVPSLAAPTPAQPARAPVPVRGAPQPGGAPTLPPA